MRLIVGLGNPGRSYSSHRHNIGFDVVDFLAGEMGVSIEKKSFGALLGEGSLNSEKVFLAKPQGYMNLSGESVAPIMGYYKISRNDLIVVHDDVDLELGRIKVSMGAGHGGHNGVRSIIDHLGNNDFFRIRAGVGRPPEHWDTADYVLAPFSPEEKKLAADVVKLATDAIKILIAEELEAAQRKFH